MGRMAVGSDDGGGDGWGRLRGVRCHWRGPKGEGVVGGRGVEGCQGRSKLESKGHNLLYKF